MGGTISYYEIVTDYTAFWSFTASLANKEHIMNTVIEAQAQVIAQFLNEDDNMSCHLFLENQHYNLTKQDLILNQANRMSVIDAQQIAKLIDGCY